MSRAGHLQTECCSDQGPDLPSGWTTHRQTQPKTGNHYGRDALSLSCGGFIQPANVITRE